KQDGEKITCLTAYDASFAQVLDKAGLDTILVGDSLGMVIQGHDSTVSVSLDDMIYHTRNALYSAARLMQEGGAQMVKLEGGERQSKTVRKLSEQGIPVCAHIGLQPQLVNKLGGYRVQGRGDAQAQAMIEDALALVAAGADMLLIECVPEALAAEITRQVEVPVIGIGASAECDGQVLVLQDILGITAGRVPKFAKNFLEGQPSIQAAIESYNTAVKDGSFPGPEHVFAS
ncbi:unnamed protein product, partial [Cyprideis torosa]